MKSDDYGKTWSKPELINDQVETLYVSPETRSMVIVDNTFHLVWEDYRDWPTESEKVYTEIYYKKGFNAGNNPLESVHLRSGWPGILNVYVSGENRNSSDCLPVVRDNYR